MMPRPNHRLMPGSESGTSEKRYDDLVQQVVDPDQIDAPDAITVVRSAPHRDVLAHTDVLLTHGGHGTVMKGLVAGVPIVCMPTGRDQPDNAARLTYRGAGVRISKKATPAKIAAGVLVDVRFATFATPVVAGQQTWMFVGDDATGVIGGTATATHPIAP